MSDARAIAADPAWLPHRIDLANQHVEFLRIPRPELSTPGFLAERRPANIAESATLGFDAVLAMRPQSGPRADPLHFIFHTAFCRSTLLVRALDIPGVSVGLSEPGIIGSLVNAGEAGAPLLKPLLALLARPHASGEVIFVKPTNHANRLIPTVLAARPETKAVLMTGGLTPFLAALVRRGMLGRRWGRQLLGELQSYAGVNFGMDARETFALTDLQVGALAWFLNQRWLHQLLAGPTGKRLRVLNADRFAAEPRRTLAAIAAFTGTPLTPVRAAQAAAAPLFATHAKLGGTFTAHEAEAHARSASPVIEEEIAQVSQWITLIAQQAGLEVPVRHSLF